ncbi:MAG: dihydrolipoamide acetyltransferase family protein [Planctomycetota bacterium]
MQKITIPRLGWSMEEGKFISWLKKPGDLVSVGEPLFELEGEKSLQEIESVEAGILYIPADAPQPGEIVPVGGLLGYLLEPGESPPSPDSQSTPEPAARSFTGHDELAAAVVKANETSLGKSPTEIDRPENLAHFPVASPRARHLAKQLQVDWSSLQGTGRDGRIRESDVQEASGRGAAGRPSNNANQGLGTISPRRKAIADRLRASRDLTIPVTLTTTIDATELVHLRQRLKHSNPRLVPAYTDIVACLIPWIYKSHPHMAVVWDTQHKGLIPVPHDQIHIGIAVDTPDGLLVPVVQQVGLKSLQTVTQESRKLIEQARTGRLPKTAMQGGVFTITNLGSYGIEAFTPIINLPEIAILGLGAIRREPVVMPDGQIMARDRITLSLSFDHAAVDGAPAASFLRDIAAAMADPAAYILNSVH